MVKAKILEQKREKLKIFTKLNMKFLEKIDTKVEEKQRIVWFFRFKEKKLNEKDSIVKLHWDLKVTKK